MGTPTNKEKTRQIFHRLTHQFQESGGRHVHAPEEMQQGGLAGPRRTNDGDELARSHFKTQQGADTFQNRIRRPLSLRGKGRA